MSWLTVVAVAAGLATGIAWSIGVLLRAQAALEHGQDELAEWRNRQSSVTYAQRSKAAMSELGMR